MRIRSNLRGTKGWLYMRERSIRFRYMITEIAKQRTKILDFWKKHGLEAVMEAYSVSKRTLYRWHRALKTASGKLESLNRGLCTPKTTRCRLWDARILEELKRIRYKHPNLGKEKLHMASQQLLHRKQTESSRNPHHWSSHCRPGRPPHGTTAHHGHGEG
jgi:hypothetical protein